MAGYIVSAKKGYLYETDFRGEAGTVMVHTITIAQANKGDGIVYWVAPATAQSMSDTAVAPVISNGNSVTRCVGIYKSNIAPGTIISYAGDKQPLGFIRCNGFEPNKEAFPDLYAAIGDTWGTTTFNDGRYFKLPDTRGQFERDLDDGKKLDPDTARALGSRQETGAPNITGYFRVRPASNENFSSDGAFAKKTSKNETTGLNIGQNFPPVGSVDIDINASRISTAYQDGLNEVRPVNYAIRKYIKY